MTKKETPKASDSFRRWLQAELTAYPSNPKPISFEGKSEPYVRAIVSTFNTLHDTSYSVLRNGKGLLVGLRSDCRNYVSQPAEQQPVAAPAVELSAAQHLQRAVELFRADYRSGDEMRAALNELITEADNYLL